MINRSVLLGNSSPFTVLNSKNLLYGFPGFQDPGPTKTKQIIYCINYLRFLFPISIEVIEGVTSISAQTEANLLSMVTSLDK